MFIVERKKEESGEIGERGGGILILGRESDKWLSLFKREKREKDRGR